MRQSQPTSPVSSTFAKILVAVSMPFWLKSGTGRGNSPDLPHQQFLGQNPGSSGHRRASAMVERPVSMMDVLENVRRVKKVS